MDWFKSIQRWYNAKIWTKAMVADGVKADKITEAQYKTITGDKYVANAE